ncbi:MAG: hypothetical protein GY786_10040 [Proteobacteria bacterium]|nr:hypothetical protein [Pseudomonadota bacterium]
MYKGLSLDQAPPEDIPIRFFLTAPLFGLIAGVLVMSKGITLFQSNWSLETIALTHLITLGWLGMIMFGAFYQMIPVLVGGTVPKVHFSRWLHLLLVAGIIIFIVSFFSLHSGEFNLGTGLFKVAVFLLVLSIVGIITQLIYAVFKVDFNNRPTVIAMRISLICLTVTLILGVTFVGNLSYWWILPWDRINMTAIHITLGLFGWVGSLIMGVGFHMIPMFYLTPSFDLETAYRILRLHSISLILIPTALIFGLSANWILIAAGPGLIAVGLFVVNLFRLIKQRKRKFMDSTLKFWQFGLTLLPISLLSVISAQLHHSSNLTLLFGVFFILGFGVMTTNGMLYKIYPFLLWFHRYSHLIGKIKVPLLQDIAPDKRSRSQWSWAVISIILFVIGTIWQDDLVLRLAGFGFSISSIMLFNNILTAYKMEVPENP